jgi:hypothetical protein
MALQTGDKVLISDRIAYGPLTRPSAELDKALIVPTANGNPVAVIVVRATSELDKAIIIPTALQENSVAVKPPSGPCGACPDGGELSYKFTFTVNPSAPGAPYACVAATSDMSISLQSATWTYSATAETVLPFNQDNLGYQCDWSPTFPTHSVTADIDVYAGTSCGSYFNTLSPTLDMTMVLLKYYGPSYGQSDKYVLFDILYPDPIFYDGGTGSYYFASTFYAEFTLDKCGDLHDTSHANQHAIGTSRTLVTSFGTYFLAPLATGGSVYIT